MVAEPVVEVFLVVCVVVAVVVPLDDVENVVLYVVALVVGLDVVVVNSMRLVGIDSLISCLIYKDESRSLMQSLNSLRSPKRKDVP